jgi:hypothetical protein
MHARVVPPTNGWNDLPASLRAELAAVVFTVRVVVCNAVPLMVTEAGILHVAGLLAAVGVIAQLRLIVPVNPPDGVKVIADVFPAVAPGVTLTAGPVMEKSGGGGGRSMV